MYSSLFRYTEGNPGNGIAPATQLENKER